MPGTGRGRVCRPIRPGVGGGQPMGDSEADLGDGELIRRAAGGDPISLAELFGRHRRRLEKMVQVRLDRALRGRVDPDDVLQETYLDLVQQLRNYPGPEVMPVFLWLRILTGQRLARVHRQHLGSAKRAAGREAPADRGGGGEVDSSSMADFLVGRLTSASGAADRAERAEIVRRAIEALDPPDREIISLRTLEGLSNTEAAAVLGLAKSAASNRYVRAMARLQAALQEIPGLIDEAQA
jgi:RNA polymerase sigma-70 factor, ECF subfamily